MDGKIGKVIEEIKQLNREKAAKFGIQEVQPEKGQKRERMTLADATFNERDELSVLFEKRPSRMLNHQTTTTENDERVVSSYESYRSMMKAEASKKVAKQNSHKEVP